MKWLYSKNSFLGLRIQLCHKEIILIGKFQIRLLPKSKITQSILLTISYHTKHIITRFFAKNMVNASTRDTRKTASSGTCGVQVREERKRTLLVSCRGDNGFRLTYSTGPLSTTPGINLPPSSFPAVICCLKPRFLTFTKLLTVEELYFLLSSPTTETNTQLF